MPEPLFNARQRAINRNLGALCLLAAGALPYAAAFLALTLYPPLEHSPAGQALAGVALVTSALLPWAVQGRVALLGNRSLRRRLANRLGELARGEFVGFSPGEGVMSWEGETDQDVGFLQVEGNTLVYRGDRFSFSLRRENLDEMRLQGVLGATPEAAGTAGRPVTVGPLRLAVYWHTPGDPGRVFTLASREADTLAEANRATRALADRLQAWWTQEQPEAEVPVVLGPPPTDTRGGVPLDRPAPGSCLSALAVGIIAFSLVWRLAADLTRTEQYTRAVLWAGLIVMSAVIFTGHFLTYLQISQGRRR